MEKQCIEYGRNYYKKKKLIFMIIMLATYGVGLMMELIFGLSLLGLNLMSEEEKNGLAPDGVVVAMIVFGVIFAAAGTVMLVIMLKFKNKMNDDNACMIPGKVIYDAKERAKEVKEKKQEQLSADIKVSKEYVTQYKDKIWLDTENKLMQMLSFEGKQQIKSQIFDLTKLKDIELLHSVEESTSFHNFDTSIGNFGTLSTNQDHFYGCEMVFNDVDKPYIKLYFKHEGEKASDFYYTILAMTGLEK